MLPFESNSRMKAAKEKLLERGASTHAKLKNRFDISATEDENVKIRTDELSQNPLTGLFLVLHKQIWSGFPITMKVLWIMCIFVGSAVQWITILLLYLYLRKEDVNPDMDSGDSKGIQLLSIMMSCGILFIYVLGEMRKSFLTSYHYWSIIEFSVLHYWIAFMLFLDMMLQCSVTVLSVLAMCEQNNISDQLGISLAFFFILEVDEWIYDTFIKDFDVLNEEDFTMKSKDMIKADDVQQYYHRKAIVGIGWVFVLMVLSGFTVAYFYLRIR